MSKVDELVSSNKRLLAIAMQVIDDVEDVSNTGDHALFYERMVANAQDFEMARKAWLASGTTGGE